MALATMRSLRELRSTVSASRSSLSMSRGKNWPRAVNRPSRSQSSMKSPGGYWSIVRYHVGDLATSLLADALALEHLVAVGIDHAALLVHHVVVLEHAFADQEVLLLDLLLGFLDLFGEHPGLDRFLVALLVHATQFVEDLVDAIAREQAHQVILGGQEEARLARVALATGTAAQLVVDPPRLVALGAADEEPSGRHHLLAAHRELTLDLGQDLLHAPLVGDGLLVERRALPRGLHPVPGQLLGGEMLG